MNYEAAKEIDSQMFKIYWMSLMAVMYESYSPHICNDESIELSPIADEHAIIEIMNGEELYPFSIRLYVQDSKYLKCYSKEDKKPYRCSSILEVIMKLNEFEIAAENAKTIYETEYEN